MSDIKLGNKFVLKSIESYVKTALVFLIIYGCFMLFKPFLLPVIWGIIIAVALYPLHQSLSKKLKNKNSLSALLITLVLLCILIVPSISFTGSLVNSVKELSTQVDEETFAIPPPPEKVAEWPLIGKKTFATWQLFSDNLSGGIEKYNKQAKRLGEAVVGTLSSFVGGLLIFILSIIIAGIFLSKSAGGYQFVYTLFTALVGEKGIEIVDNSKATIRSVVSGVLGTAIIQTAIIAAALFVFKVPGAPILTVIVLFFAIAQLPSFLVILPVVIYMFTILPGTQAIVFTIWAILGSLSDNFIKPMLLGRGMKIPMLVILIGAIGGMLLMGIIGLFIGAVLMALGYQLFYLWLEDAKEILETKKTE